MKIEEGYLTLIPGMRFSPELFCNVSLFHRKSVQGRSIVPFRDHGLVVGSDPMHNMQTGYVRPTAVSYMTYYRFVSYRLWLVEVVELNERKHLFLWLHVGRW